MSRFWYVLFFAVAIAALSGTIAACEAFLAEPGLMPAVRAAAWAVFLAADGFMLLFQDYRQQKALGRVKAPVGIFERMLRKRGRPAAHNGKGVGL